jgi:hypothetical protein
MIDVSSFLFGLQIYQVFICCILNERYVSGFLVYSTLNSVSGLRISNVRTKNYFTENGVVESEVQMPIRNILAL